MTDLAIRVENLGKLYRIGRAQRRHDTLRDAIAAGLSSLRPSTANEEETIWALSDVSFEVKRGEVLGIIGRNGAGKSTLLKILSRITEPTTGRAEIHGRVGSLLEVGTGFHPELTGRENIYLNGAILGMRRAEIAARFDEIVAFAEIERFLDTPVKRYSSGMYVRLAFAVAAHLDPEILLVDEVLAVGDAAFQQKCLGKMGEVSQEGRNILLVSHNLPYVAHICHRALLLSNGEIRSDGPSLQVIDLYSRLNQANATTGVLAFDTSETLVKGDLSVPRVEMLSDTGRLLNKVAGGQPLRVRIHYRCDTALASPSFAVTFASGGVEILRLSTLPISGYQLPELRGCGYVDCILDRVPFTGGTYALGVGVGRPNVEYLVFDSNVGSFEVVPYDAYRSGFGVDRRCGVMVTSHQWELHQA